MFEEILYNLTEKIRSKYSVDSISQQFKVISTDCGKVADCYRLLKDAQLLPQFEREYTKSCSVSESHRLEGNKAFGKRNDIVALQCYTLSIAFAPSDSQELVLSYANRSAVTSSLAEYENTLKDIEMALYNNNYPEKLKYKLFERKGRALIKLGQMRPARKSIQEALAMLPNSQLDERKQNHLKSQLVDLLRTMQDFLRPTEFLSEVKIPEIDYGRSEEIDCSSGAVAIEYTEEMGRHLVTTMDVKPGAVLAVEDPYAAVLLPSAYTMYCFACQRRCHSLKPCPHCTKALFCSAECQAACWAESHEVECPLLPLLLVLGCGKMVLLSVRILLVATCQGRRLRSLAAQMERIETVRTPRTKGFNDRHQYTSADYEATHHLEGNKNLRTTADLFRRATLAACIVHCLDRHTNFFSSEPLEEHTKPSLMIGHPPSAEQTPVQAQFGQLKAFAGGLIMRHLQSMPCNAHEVSEMCVYGGGQYESCEIGGAVYPLLSLVNHSCDPNVVRHSHCGTTVALTAIQAIPKGQQLLDNYGYHHAVDDRATRQSRLLSQYYFTCRCIACLQDWPRYQQLPSTNPTYLPGSSQNEVEKSSAEFQMVLAELLEGRGLAGEDDTLAFLYNHLTLLQRSVARPWSEYSQCQEAIKQRLSLKANHYILNTARTNGGDAK